MSKLSFIPTAQVDQITWPKTDLTVTLASSALQIFTDFKHSKPLVLESSISAVDASTLMKKAHVRFKIIVNENNSFLGVVSTEDLSEQALMTIAAAGVNRKDIAVTDLMQPKSELTAIDREDIDHATIGDVIEALKDHGHQHCLVVDKRINQVCGLFSASDITRVLHLPIDIQKKSSFLEVARMTRPK